MELILILNPMNASFLNWFLLGTKSITFGSISNPHAFSPRWNLSVIRNYWFFTGVAVTVSVGMVYVENVTNGVSRGYVYCGSRTLIRPWGTSGWVARYAHNELKNAKTIT